MELHYRGATYNHENTPVELTDNCVIAHYRGGTTKICQSKQTATRRLSVPLRYRGLWVK